MASTETGVRSVKGQSPAAFRPDIEGMRALAIGLILVCHAGVRQLPGGFVGVDVFFVISGFLITRLLIREIERTGRVSLPRFYARRAKRLLPAIGVVLVATAALSWLTATVGEWRTFGTDIVAAALQVANWRFAHRSVDYLAEDADASPVLHFWSLAVEAQFLIVWPLLLVALAWWLSRNGHLRRGPVLAVGVLAVTVPSLIYSIYLATVDPDIAFFATPTRLWELGIGALVAIGATVWGRVPRGVALVLGWGGVGSIVASALVFTPATPWPGFAALAPTLGTAGMIIAGYTSSRAGPSRLLSWGPAVWVGGLSYSLYLWHWPFVVAATALWGELGGKRGLLVVAASVIPAFLSYKLIEKPIRFAKALSRSNPLTLSLGLNLTAIGVVAAMVLVLAVPPSTGGSDDRQAQGALAIGSNAEPKPGSVESLQSTTWYVPDATQAVEDVPPPYAQDCQVDQVSVEPKMCEWGDPDGDLTIAVVGDSKVLQWWSALDQIAQDQGWRIISFTKSACGFHDGMQTDGDEPYQSCDGWNDNVLAKLLELRPDAVVTSQRKKSALEDAADVSSLSTDVMVDALVRHWTALDDGDIPVIALLDNPSPGMTVYECVAEHPDDLGACTFDLEEGISSSGAVAQVAAAERVPRVKTIDMQPAICPDVPCVPIIGNVLLYRQGTHLTDTYVRSLIRPLQAELVPIIEGLD